MKSKIEEPRIQEIEIPTNLSILLNHIKGTGMPSLFNEEYDRFEREDAISSLGYPQLHLRGLILPVRRRRIQAHAFGKNIYGRDVIPLNATLPKELGYKINSFAILTDRLFILTDAKKGFWRRNNYILVGEFKYASFPTYYALAAWYKDDLSDRTRIIKDLRRIFD